MFVGWLEALAPEQLNRLYPAAVAGDCMIAGYDLLDAIYDQHDPQRTRAVLVPAGLSLLHLAQEFMLQVDAPAERRAVAARALAHGGRRAWPGHLQDYARRGGAAADPAALLLTVRQRSGSLVAAFCSAAALIAGGSWRAMGLAARFGRAFAVAAQLEDDLDDRHDDAGIGRQTLPILIGMQAEDAVVEATTWVLIRRSLLECASVLKHVEQLGTPGSTDHLWSLLPPELRATTQPASASAAVTPGTV